MLIGRLPRNLDERLAAIGCRVRRATVPGMPFVIEDREVLTARDPLSAHVVAALVAYRLDGGNR